MNWRSNCMFWTIIFFGVAWIGLGFTAFIIGMIWRADTALNNQFTYTQVEISRYEIAQNEGQWYGSIIQCIPLTDACCQPWQVYSLISSGNETLALLTAHYPIGNTSYVYMGSEISGGQNINICNNEQLPQIDTSPLWTNFVVIISASCGCGLITAVLVFLFWRYKVLPVSSGDIV